MAYKINRHDEYVIAPDGIATVKDVSRLRSELMQLSPEFYELEPAEVLKVYLDEEDLPYIGETENRDWSFYGWAEVRMAISSKNEEDTEKVCPLDSNIKEHPLPGEIVIVVEYFGKRYYTQKLNLDNSVNINFRPGLTKWTLTQNVLKQEIKDFNDNQDIRQLQAEEGDIIFNGRFGQSIRFGSNITEVEGDEKNTNKEDSPNIIIRTGQGVIPDTNINKPIKEDINADGSSIWMVTDQVIPFVFSNNETPGSYVFAEKGQDGLGGEKSGLGSQIIINSDRLVFNAKKNNILMTSPGFIGLSANSEIGLEVPNDTGRVLLGDSLADQPVLGGDQTMKLISLLIDGLISFAGELRTVVGGGNTGSPVPVSGVNISASTFYEYLRSLRTRLDEPKSKTVRVGHMRGPA